MDDIFGSDSLEAPKATAASATTNNLEEFDDIFGDSSTAELGGASSEQATSAPAGLAGAGGGGTDEFDDIFGDSAGETAPVESSSISIIPAQDGDDDDDTTGGGGGITGGKDSATGSTSASTAAAASTGTAGGDKEFLDFLYEDDVAAASASASASASAPEGTPVESSPARARSPADSGSPLGEEGSFLETPAAVASPIPSKPQGASVDPLPPRSPLSPHSASGTGAGAVPPETIAIATATTEAKPKPPTPGKPALDTFVRKERVEVLRPLPDDPAAALRELVPQAQPATAADTETETEDEAEAEAAAADVGYIRRLCVATGGFLPPDLRPVVWSLLLGRGKSPADAAFAKWRAQRRENPPSVTGAAAVSYKLDLWNDCLALARRLCDDARENSGGAGAIAGAAARDNPEALALDIEEVLTFYCTRRSEAYEPILCTLVGPLFSMGLDPVAVSAMLNPLVGSLTLFLGRGLTHAVRDLAWAHAHRRLHDLCTYHDPELVQHLNRSFPGWEMPLPAASASRAETSALDQEAAAMVDDLESSLPAFVPRRRASMADAAAHETEAANGSRPTAAARSARTEGQGLVEPSLLVAANAGLGAAAPLGQLLPLWDYLLVRHDKHFGFFLLLAILLRRREELLVTTGPKLRVLLAETLSPSAMATLLACGNGDAADADKNNAALTLWCQEAEALDLATPESFRHHLALIGEIAEAEYEAAVQTRAREGAAGGAGEASAGPAVAAATQSGGREGGAPSSGPAKTEPQKTEAAGQAAEEAKGLNHPSLLRMRTMMKSAGDKLAADLKNLKLARPSEVRQSSEELAAPTELMLPQLCLAVSAKELVAGVTGRGRGRSGGAGSSGNKEGVTGSGTSDVDAASGDEGKGKGKGQPSLFRQRQSLSFFAVDCRPKRQVDSGRFPTAYHLDPTTMDNPEEMAETIMPVFEPLRKRAHVCLVGAGNGHLRERGLGLRGRRDGKLQQGGGGGGGGGIGSLKAERDEYSFVNSCALFFMKRGFPYVSVLEGGFAAAHELMEATNGRGAEESEDAALSTAIGAAGNTEAGDGGGRGGLLFPLSPPLWARIGAADSSASTFTHGVGISAGGKDATKGNNTGAASPFFPAKSSQSQSHSPGTEKTSTSNHSISTASAKSGGEGSVGGDDVGEVSSGGGSAGTAPAPAPAASAAAAVGSNLFKGGASASAMFSGMKMNMGGIFSKGGAGATGLEEAAAAATTAGAGAGADADGAHVAESSGAQPAKMDSAADLAAKFRTSMSSSFGRFGGAVSKEAKKGPDGYGVGTAGGAAVAKQAAAGAAGSDEKEKDSGFGSLFRKAQSFKAADVAAAFADLRDGPKSFGPATSAAAASSTSMPSKGSGGAQQVVEVVEEGADEDGDGAELFVIGDDGSEASEAPDSDFEGFDGEHPPVRGGGARSAADKEVALLEHRLSGQIKGATMVVDEFLKVPGAKIFNVMKHKVTFHDVDATPDPSAPENASEAAGRESKDDSDGNTAAAAADAAGAAKDDSDAKSNGGDTDTDTTTNTTNTTNTNTTTNSISEKKKVRVRAVTELERVVFLSRERILLLACPAGPTKPGLVKSNHHLTELQKMTFMRRDPSLVTLHYLAPERPVEEEGGAAGAEGSEVAAAVAATKRNVYRFGLDDKEAFIRIIRGALQRFQA